ncbi:MAG: hypothetical protein ACJ8IK_09700 [Burkholderiaceae bacterium]
MNMTTDRVPVVDKAHKDLKSMRAAVSTYPIWIAADAGLADRAQSTPLAERLRIHRLGAAACAVVDKFRPDDAAVIADIASHCFVNDPTAITKTFTEGHIPWHLASAGCELHFRQGSDANVDSRIRRHGVMSSLEFMLSDRPRLDQLSRLTTGTTHSERPARGQHRRAVVLLDMIQDFEILRPLLVRAAGPGSPFDLIVAVSERLAASHLWTAIKSFLDVHEIRFFTPIGPVDIANALGSERSLLLGAAESSAAAHAFGYTAFRTASPRTTRVSIQHGLECIGLRHHRAHDIDFSNGVRFASDLILTWIPNSALTNVHPAEAHKCVPVGVVKASSERAATLLEEQWRSDGEATRHASRHRMLIAENLHSVRFRTPARYQRFLAFIEAVAADPGIDLTIRSHPASRTLEKRSGMNNMTFLGGVLRADDLASFDSFVSPPSTIVLDAVSVGVRTGVWTDAAVHGDAANYAGLQIVTDPGDLAPLTSGANDVISKVQALKWGVGATASLNGVPAAWNLLCQLIG